ncbi:hypothetical protein F5H01DRAFT_325739 [Linnemannia elongata]|nr:hypothetical protein F5H01DRAFT_325739 [Linnemannia elongata]
MHDLYTAEHQKYPYEPFITGDLLELADNHAGSWGEYFLNEKAADEFMNYSNTKHIEQYWRKDKDETNFFTAEIKGKFPLAIPTVACYGPGKDDWAIVIPDYDPGYAFKSPKVRLPYNRIMLITRVVYFITVSTLETHLPKKAVEPIQKFLLSVIRDTMKVLNRNGILALLDRAKVEMKQFHVTQTQHLHTAGHGLNKSEIQQSITNTHMKAIGHPDSQERADQWNDLIESRTIPCPNALAYGTGVHRS